MINIMCTLASSEPVESRPAVTLVLPCVFGNCINQKTGLSAELYEPPASRIFFLQFTRLFALRLVVSLSDRSHSLPATCQQCPGGGTGQVNFSGDRGKKVQ